MHIQPSPLGQAMPPQKTEEPLTFSKDEKEELTSIFLP